jgi:lysophospholipid acyltransferase (LPLAT)-like uncharacterized protein
MLKIANLTKPLSIIALRSGLLVALTGIVRLYHKTIKIHVTNESMVTDYLQTDCKAIFAVWHQRIFAAFCYAGVFGVYQPSVMVSKSRDGDIGADFIARLNFRPIRGSSSQGGKEALAVMAEDIRQNRPAAHVVDGPRGPVGVVKPGLIRLAQLSGAAIFPVLVSANNVWTLKSWDRMMIPKPFSSVYIRWDGPIFIPENLDGDAFESWRKIAEERMRKEQRQDDRQLGWPEDLLWRLR